MEKENNFIEGEKVEDTKNDFKPIGNITKNNNFNFTKQILLPFVSGIIGTTLVIGICFGVPNIRNYILQNDFSTNNNTNSSTSSNTSSSTNTSLVSLSNYSETGISVAQKVLPSVVGINVEYSVSSIFYRNTGSTATAEGSGIIISTDGYILTNNHIVNSTVNSSYYELGKANKVTVYLYNDSTAYEASIIGTDEQTDLAVIKIDKSGLVASELGDSNSVQVGEFAMAIGNPLGMQSSVSSGMISAVNRKVTTDGKVYTLIQTDAAINSGNSGGALVNSKGQVIGINTLKMAGSSVEGMGFAIPINSTKTIYEQLIQYNKVKRPYIGINGRNLDEDTAKANNLVVGVYVLSVEKFSAAEKAGINIGDVIIEINDKKISSIYELNEITNSYSIGDEVKLKIYRDGNEKEITVTLQEQ